MLFYLLEISVYLVYRFGEGEGVVVFFQHILKIDHLVLVDDADQYRLFGLTIRAERRYTRYTVLEIVENVVGYLVGVRGDYGESVSALRASDYVVSNKAGYKAVENAQTNGLVVVCQRARLTRLCVYEEGDRRNYCVESEGHPEEVEIAAALAYVL